MSSANATGMEISLTGTLFQMFLVVAIGLGVASLLYRIVTAAARRRKSARISEDRHNIDRSKEQDQFTEDWQRSIIAAANDREDQQQHRSCDDRDQFSDDLHRSLIPGKRACKSRYTLDELLHGRHEITSRKKWIGVRGAAMGMVTWPPVVPMQAI